MRDSVTPWAATVAACLLLAAPAGAQAPEAPRPPQSTTAASKDPATAPAGTYAIDPLHAAVVARVLHHGMSYNIIRFGVSKGVLTWDAARPETIKLDVTVDTQPHTEPVVYRYPLDGPNFLNVAKFPEARFVSMVVRPIGATQAEIQGELTLMGVTKPAVIRAQLVGAGRSMTGKPTLGFTGTMVVKWSDFTKPVMPGLISEDVTVVLEGEFGKI